MDTVWGDVTYNDGQAELSSDPLVVQWTPDGKQEIWTPEG
jgi:hypothetical protein